MQKEIVNKAVVEKKTKTTIETQTQNEPMFEVYLKNMTSIKGKLFKPWIHSLTKEEYEAVKNFL